MLNTTRMWASRVLFHPHSLSIACGGAAGTAWIAACASYWTAFEPVPAARITFVLAWAMSLALMWLPSVSGVLNRVPHFWRVGAASCGLALWPAAWKAVLSRRELIPLDWYAGQWTSLVAMAIPAVLILVPMIVLGTLLCPVSRVSASDTPRQPPTAFWIGVALSWCVLPTTLFVRSNADQVLLSLSACLLVGAGLSLFLRIEVAESSPSLLHSSSPPSEIRQPRRRRFVLAALVAALLIGISVETANRAAEQLILESLPLKLLGWAGFLIGAAFCLGWKKHGPEHKAEVQRGLWLTAMASAAVLVLFPIWIRLGIWSSANLSFLPFIVLMKGLVPFGILLPFGYACGTLLRCSPHQSLLSLLVGIGYAFATAATWPMTGVLVSSTCLAIGLWLVLFPREFWKELTSHQGRNRRTATLASGLSLIAITIGCHTWLDPARSARLLFNGEAFAAAGSGHDLLTIERADRSRWLRTIEGQNGVWTIWRQRANQLMVRKNGLPAGQLSLDSSLGPQNFWSVMTAAVPLVVHPQANTVLCLGTPGAIEINTLLGFPVQSLTCVEGDREVRSLIAYESELIETSSRLADGRLEWMSATPMQFAASQATQTYDVIVCPVASSIPLRSQPQYTQEFHTRIARHLNTGGVFCQRMNIIDFGSAPLVATLRSLRSAFDQTCVITTDGSEVLLLASNSPAPLFQPGMMTRLDTPHVKHLCASLGGDWSMITQLACVQPQSVDDLLAGSTGLQNSCMNARFTMSLASETLRWGPKWKEKQVLFSNRTGLVLMALGLEDEVQQTIVRRIQDAQERTRILTERADDQWSYRRILKTALKDRPRSTIQRVNHEIRQTLSVDDQHRKDYLVALGRAAREEHPSLESIEKIESFAIPYDPLMTDFVHFEVAHLLGRASTTDPVREYHNWMHCITYAPDTDRSVRPVASALDLLRRNPQIVPDPAWRWDQFCQLLDVMRVRWNSRWQAGVTSKYEAADMQHSIEAITATLTAMDELAPQAGLDQETWKVQRRIWVDSLVSPTRSRLGNGQTRNQMLDTVRQEWLRRNSELAEPK